MHNLKTTTTRRTTRTTRPKTKKMTDFIELATTTPVIFFKNFLKQRPIGGQDYTTIFKDVTDVNGEVCDVMALFDGHGSDHVINLIRDMPMCEIMKMDHPLLEIRSRIKEQQVKKTGGFHRSGSTYTCAKIYQPTPDKPGRITHDYMGDSPIWVFKNGELIYKSLPHIALKFPDMIEDFKTRYKCVTLIPDDKITPSSDKILTCVKNSYTDISYITDKGATVVSRMMPIRALGHNEIFEPVTFEEPQLICVFGVDDKICVVQGSDGLDDMLLPGIDDQDLQTLSPSELVLKTYFRWMQSWNMDELCKESLLKRGFSKNAVSFGEVNRDDISCAVWRNY